MIPILISKLSNCKEKLFPDRPEEAAMFGCKSLSTEIIETSSVLENLYKIELYNRMRGLVKNIQLFFDSFAVPPASFKDRHY